MIKPCISREFAYFLKQEHLYAKYRAYKTKLNVERQHTSEEYVFWNTVYVKFYKSLVKKYKCEKDIILKLS